MNVRIPYDSELFGGREGKLRIFTKGLIKIPDKNTDLLDFLGARGTVMTQCNDHREQSHYENDYGELQLQDKIVCPMWQFESLKEFKEYFGNWIIDCGDHIKKVEVWQVSQKCASMKETNKLEQEIDNGLKPIDNWKSYLNQEKYFWDVQSQNIKGEYYLSNGKVFLRISRDRYIEIYSMKKAYMYFEKNADGDIIGTSGDFFSAIGYTTSLRDYGDIFLRAQEKMNQFIAKGELKDPNNELHEALIKRVQADIEAWKKEFGQLTTSYCKNISDIKDRDKEKIQRMAKLGQKLKCFSEVLELEQ